MNNIDYEAVVEILENFLKKEKTEILGISVGEERQVRLAIENLIQENKELKEIRDSLLWQKNFDTKILDEDYIPKSKVKEIVELYDNTLQCTRKYNQDLADILCDFEELLEEGE